MPRTEQAWASGGVPIGARVSDVAIGTKEPTGFHLTNQDCTLSIVEATRTLTITPTAGRCDVWFTGRRWSFTSPLSVQWTDVQGQHYFYIDRDETLKAFAGDFDEALLNSGAVYAANIYWDKANGEAVVAGDERHGLLPWEMHLLWHLFEGPRILSGLVVGDVLADQSGNLDTHAELSVSSGSIIDEDLTIARDAVAVGSFGRVWSKVGASGNWISEASGGAPLINAPLGGRPYYNEWTGATWQQTEISNDKYMLAHIVVTNDWRTGRQVVAIMGEEQYNSASDARLGATAEKNALTLAGLPAQEFVFLVTLIYQCSSSYSNTYKARTRSTDTGDDYIEWGNESRNEGAGGGSAKLAVNVATDTAAFAGILSAADIDVQKALDTLDDHAIADHDTSATGAELTALTDGTRVANTQHHHEIPICSVRNSATQDLSGTNVAATWGAVLHATQGSACAWSSGAPTRITIAENGWYQISFNLCGTSTTARAQINARIRANGSTFIGPMAGSGYIRYVGGYNAESSVACGPFTLYLTSGSYLEVVCNEVGPPGSWTSVNQQCSFTVIQLMSNA